MGAFIAGVIACGAAAFFAWVMCKASGNADKYFTDEDIDH